MADLYIRPWAFQFEILHVSTRNYCFVGKLPRLCKVKVGSKTVSIVFWFYLLPTHKMQFSRKHQYKTIKYY